MITHNMGSTERIIRLLGGALLALFATFYPGMGIPGLDAFGAFWNSQTGVLSVVSAVGFILLLVGVAVFVTGWAAFCPINALLHANSCEACRVGEKHAHVPI